MMIPITIRSYALLPHTPPSFKLGHPFELAVEEGTTLEQLSDKALTIPQGRVALVAVNGRRTREDYVLQAQDRVDLFPPIGGG